MHQRATETRSGMSASTVDARAPANVSGYRRLRALVAQPPTGASSTVNPAGMVHRGRLSLLTFFGEAKKVSGSGAAPRIGLRRTATAL
jgi:hypothetical protein